MPLDEMGNLQFQTKTQKVHEFQQGKLFGTGKTYSIESYRKMASEFEERWYNEHREFGRGDVAAITRKFWEIVCYGAEDLTVEYGSDVSRSSACSEEKREPRSGASILEQVWDLQSFSRQSGFLFEHLADSIDGMTEPWLYFGMLFSGFSFHTEDSWLFSVNYHHWGAPKVWYGIPSAAADKFEKVMKDNLLTRFQESPDLLHALVALLSPEVLKKNKIPVYQAVQRPGEFIITCPRAYHGGFNAGLNCAEAVNFALPSWIPYGIESRKSYFRFGKAQSLNLDKLIHAVARKSRHPEQVAWWVVVSRPC